MVIKVGEMVIVYSWLRAVNPVSDTTIISTYRH